MTDILKHVNESKADPPHTGEERIDTDPLVIALKEIASMKREPGETTDTFCFNRCWHIATEALSSIEVAKQEGMRWVNAAAVPPYKGIFIMKIIAPKNKEEREYISKNENWISPNGFWHWYNIPKENYHLYEYLSEPPSGEG